MKNQLILKCHQRNKNGNGKLHNLYQFFCSYSSTSFEICTVLYIHTYNPVKDLSQEIYRGGGIFKWIDMLC